jgi:hypothetical protein
MLAMAPAIGTCTEHMPALRRFKSTSQGNRKINLRLCVEWLHTGESDDAHSMYLLAMYFLLSCSSAF